MTIPYTSLLILAIVLIVVGLLFYYGPIPFPLAQIGSIITWIGIIVFVVWLILFIVAVVKSA